MTAFVINGHLQQQKNFFQRISVFQTNSNSYINFSIPHHILFFIMASIPIDQTQTFLKTIIQKIVKHFKLSEEDKEELRQCYNSPPRITGKQDNLFLMKGNYWISIFSFYSDLENIPSELKSFWNAIFNVLLTHHRKRLLFVGASCFKTFLASHILKIAPILVVDSETIISQLLGSIMLVNSKRSKEFFLNQFC
jgi:hypothetical protein